MWYPSPVSREGRGWSPVLLPTNYAQSGPRSISENNIPRYLFLNICSRGPYRDPWTTPQSTRYVMNWTSLCGEGRRGADTTSRTGDGTGTSSIAGPTQMQPTEGSGLQLLPNPPVFRRYQPQLV